MSLMNMYNVSRSLFFKKKDKMNVSFREMAHLVARYPISSSADSDNSYKYFVVWHFKFIVLCCGFE